MSAPLPFPTSELAPRTEPHSRRPAWRKRLVDLERGLMFGFRASGVVAVHFFCATIGLLAGLLLGLSFRDWGILIVCFASSLALELGSYAVSLLARATDERSEPARQAQCVATAAATLAMCGSIIAAVCVLVSRALVLWGD